MTKKKKKKGGKMCELTITAGCGKGRKCDISLYITPQGATNEVFRQYVSKRLKDMKEDAESRVP